MFWLSLVKGEKVESVCKLGGLKRRRGIGNLKIAALKDIYFLDGH